MKTYTKKQEFESSGGGQAMSIQNSAKIINILVSSMYSDKYKAIWREMIANGWDSQVEAGTSHIPPDVTMPSMWESTFRYRDYGTGLTHDFMMNKYTVVGFSTKENTNNAVGKWGLGRLVPLSYTDTYTIISYQGGMARHYAISRSPEGITCVPMGESPTKEANGLEVSFPIQQQDASKFAEALKYISLGMSVKPRATNVKDFEWPAVPVSTEGSCWKYLDPQKLPYGSPLRGQAHVRMGCVLYPIDKQYDFAGESVILEAPIGSLAVTASREALSYGPDEPTDKTIRRLLAKFAAEVVDEQVKKTLSAKTYTEALMFHMKTLGDLRGAFRTAYTKRVTNWKGYYLPEAGYFYPDVDILQWGWEFSNDKRVQVTKGGSIRSLRHDNINNVHVVVENVTEGSRDTRGPKRILQWWRAFEEKERPEFLAWIQLDETDKGQIQHLIEFFCKFPDWPVTLVKDMPDIPKTVRVKNKVKAKRLSSSLQTSIFYSQLDVTIEDFDQGGYYIKTENNRLCNFTGGEAKFLSWVQALRTLKEIPEDTEIYVAPKTLWSKFEGNNKWVELAPKVKPMLLKHLPGFRSSAATYVDQRHKDQFLTSFEGCSSLIDSYLKGWDSQSYLTIPSSRCLSLLHELGEDAPVSTLEDTKSALLKKIYELYPLLGSKDYRMEKHYKDYIKLINTVRVSYKETENV